MNDDSIAEVFRLSDLLDKDITELRRMVVEAANRESEYRRVKAQKWVEAPVGATRGEWTAAQRESWVNAETGDLRAARDIADGLRQAALEATRNHRAQLSAMQSWLNADRAELEFARTSPRLEP